MAIVKKYPSKILSIQNSIEGIYTLEFESLGRPYKYDAGQFLHLAIDEYDPSEQWPESRCFSMQSASNEEIIKITYAAKGQFTRRMEQQLKVGSEVTIKLPYGDLFVQEHNKENTVFIAGGTGITPFLSLFTDAQFASYNNAVLYAGFRTQAMNLYQTELDKAKAINSSFESNCIYQDKEGILDIEKILENHNLNTYFFISGPPVMIKNFKQTLISKGVKEENVLTDDWE